LKLFILPTPPNAAHYITVSSIAIGFAIVCLRKWGPNFTWSVTIWGL